MTLVVKHSTVTNAAPDATALVDGPAWDAGHVITGSLSAADLSDGITGSGSVVLSTSPTLTTPSAAIEYGGAAVGSTKTINGTSSGSPSNAYLLLQSNGQFVGVGNTTPQYQLHIGPGTDASSLSAVQFYLSANGTTSFAVRDSTNHIEFGMFTNHAPDVTALGSRTNHPLWIQTNSSNNFAFHVSTGFSVGSTTDPGAGNVSATGGFIPGSFTVANLPGSAATGKTVWCSNCRVFNGAGVQEGLGAGTGGLVSYNGTAWKIAGTNITAIA